MESDRVDNVQLIEVRGWAHGNEPKGDWRGCVQSTPWTTNEATIEKKREEVKKKKKNEAETRKVPTNTRSAPEFAADCACGGDTMVGSEWTMGSGRTSVSGACSTALS